MKRNQIILFIGSLFILLSLYSNAQDAQTISAKNDSIQHEIVHDESTDKTFSEKINDKFTPIVDAIGSVLFWDPFSAAGIYDPVIYDEEGNISYDENGNTRTSPIPFVVVWLMIGALFFTIFMRFINFRGFRHAIDIVRGKYDDPNDKGEVSHFQALTTALSATVGLGNIASVAVAIVIGGPGATFWMILAGLLGMSSKFVECTLGVKYRKIDMFGQVSGGPMYYLYIGLKKKGLKWLGAFLAVVFAVLVIGGSLGGGNMFQANQAFSQVALLFPSMADYGAYFGIIVAILVGFVIIGGIKSIARVTDKIVPFMAALYVLTALVVIFMNIDQLGNALTLIYEGAFSAPALKGGFIGVLIIGFQRAAFSNEAGVGSSAIAHSAVRTDKPIKEGLVSLLEPFVDTVVICTLTALVIIFTGMYTNPNGVEGAQLTSQAFGSAISWFPYVLVIAIFLFAFSTMVSWSYYGLKGFDYLFGAIFEKWFGNRKVAATVYRVIFLVAIVVGASSELGAVLAFSDMMILSMAIPNILGLIILAPEVKRDLKVYWAQVKSGEIKKYK